MPTDDLLGNHVDFIDPSRNGKLAPKVKKKKKIQGCYHGYTNKH